MVLQQMKWMLGTAQRRDVIPGVMRSHQDDRLSTQKGEALFLQPVAEHPHNYHDAYSKSSEQASPQKHPRTHRLQGNSQGVHECEIH